MQQVSKGNMSQKVIVRDTLRALEMLTRAEKYRFADALSGHDIPTRHILRKLGIAPSSYYYHKTHPKRVTKPEL